MKTMLLLIATPVLFGGEVWAGPRELAPQAGAPVEFRFEPRGVYPVLAAPGRITDIVLEPGETLVETNAIAAGDTARWIIGDTTSGEGATRRVHVLIKPTLPTLSTNLVINTTRRTYFLDVRASARGYLTQVSWRYAEVVIPSAALAPAPVEVAPPKFALNFGYRITGAPGLRPERVFDDGQNTTIVFSDRQPKGDLPALYRIATDGKAVELINYRIEKRSLVVDGLLDRAELRLGAKGSAKRVRIVRETGR